MGLISTQEAADRLGVTIGRVRHMIYAGRLKATKIGKVWIIDTKDLEAVRHRKPGRPRNDPSKNK